MPPTAMSFSTLVEPLTLTSCSLTSQSMLSSMMVFRAFSLRAISKKTVAMLSGDSMPMPFSVS
jgi:hypothetical protein